MQSSLRVFIVSDMANTNPLAAVVAEALTGEAAVLTAQAIANQNGAPVAVMEGLGSYRILDDPEAYEDACALGWPCLAIVDPDETCN